jgi:predicted aspartyl protease
MRKYHILGLIFSFCLFFLTNVSADTRVETGNWDHAVRVGTLSPVSEGSGTEAERVNMTKSDVPTSGMMLIAEWRHVGSSGDNTAEEKTSISLSGNRIVVPVTIEYDGSENTVELLLDTGATGTMIISDVAERLSINLSKTRKTRVQVVGGAVLEASIIRLQSLTVGPHTKRNLDIVVMPHEGPATQYDGLLGMDVLRGLKYRIDYRNHLIIWE